MNDAENHKDTWHTSNEREFIENLVNQRINFFIVFYSLILSSAVGAPTQNHLTIVLILGAVICTLLALPIFMLAPKLNSLIETVRQEKGHPAAIVHEQGKMVHARLDRDIILYGVPSICALSLVVGVYMSVAGLIRIP